MNLHSDMNLEEKLRQLQSLAKKTRLERLLERQLESLRHAEPGSHAEPPSSAGDLTLLGPNIPRPAAYRIEEFVEGHIETRKFGEIFVAGQSLPFGRPYGKLRIGDIPGVDFAPLGPFFGGSSLPDPARLVFLDTETTGLAGREGVFAFLIGIGRVEGMKFAVRQYFLRDGGDEKAALAALAEELEKCEGLVTFNGKAFDVPLLETRYTLHGLSTPFEQVPHFDLLHPARRLWKLRLKNCQLTNLERHVLGIARAGDVPGSEIPGIYFDYLRTGDARGLQPVFFHNALDIVSLAALGVEMARMIQSAQQESSPLREDASLDFFSLSRIFGRAGATGPSISACQRALRAGLPEQVEARALCYLAAQHKRQEEFLKAVEIWRELARHSGRCALEAYRELAIHYEWRERDIQTALKFIDAALEILNADSIPWLDARIRALHLARFTRRHERLQKRMARHEKR